MSHKMYKIIIVLCGIFLITGCKKGDSDSNVPDMNEVIEETSEAMETGVDYLDAQSQAAIETAAKTYVDLENNIQDLISEIKDSGEERMQDMSNKLDSQLSDVKQKFTSLKEAGEEDYQNAEDAFNVAIDELNDTYKKAKEEFEKNGQK